MHMVLGSDVDVGVRGLEAGLSTQAKEGVIWSLSRAWMSNSTRCLLTDFLHSFLCDLDAGSVLVVFHCQSRDVIPIDNGAWQ